jgi:DNA-binding MarR family transcriptional regulator
MDKVQVSRAVAGLMRRKRVARIGDARDGRITRLSLTSQGAAIYEEIVPTALALESAFLAALAPAERSAFLSLLEKLMRRIDGLRVVAR